MDKDQCCCGECTWHRRGNSVDSYYCNNPESDYYTDYTMYDDSCEEGERI